MIWTYQDLGNAHKLASKCRKIPNSSNLTIDPTCKKILSSD